MNLKELAEHLQLSPTTVSRALNGYPEVSEVTRQRVSEAATRLHYRPSHHARRLATGQSFSIGIVIPRSRQSVIGPHFSDIMSGTSDVCATHGYEMLLTMVDDDKEEALYRDLAATRRVDGVILQGPTANDARIKLLLELGLPFLVHGRSSGIDQTYDWLDVNNRDAIHRATEFLINLGHKRIAFINGHPGWSYSERRSIGFQQAMQEHDLNVPDNFLAEGELSEAHGHDKALALLQQETAPTALVSSGILPAFGALRAIHSLNLTLARDVSIITYDDQLNYIENPGEVPLFTSVRSSIRDAGARLTELLIDRIKHPERETVNELWDVELVVGRSTAHPRIED